MSQFGPLTADDYKVAEELLERKLCTVSNAAMHAITVKDIVSGAARPKFPYKEEDEVPYAATLAGILAYRGHIADYIRSNTPLTKWDDDVLLSYWLSNVDQHRNFHLSYQQTRSQTYQCVAAITNGVATSMQAAYTLACLEAQDVSPILWPGRPVLYRQIFVEMFKKNPGGYVLNGMRKVARMLEKRDAYFLEQAQKWNDGGYKTKDPERHNSIRIFYALCGDRQTVSLDDEDLNTPPLFVGLEELEHKIDEAKGENRRPRKRRRKHRPRAAEEIPGPAVQAPAIGPADRVQDKEQPWESVLTLDVAKYKEVLGDNPIWLGLVEAFPGFYPYDVKKSDLSDDIHYERMVYDGKSANKDNEGQEGMAEGDGDIEASGELGKLNVGALRDNVQKYEDKNTDKSDDKTDEN